MGSHCVGGKQPINNVEVTDRTNKNWPMIKTDEQIDRQDLCTQLMDSIDMKAFTVGTATNIAIILRRRRISKIA